MTVATEWKWFDGDIGRYKTIEYRNQPVVIELAPLYMGRGAYTEEWYMFLWEAKDHSSEDFVGDDGLLANFIPIDIMYVTDENGNEIPVAADLDAKADYILEHMKVCTTCNRYCYVDSGNYVMSNNNIFCCANHLAMWESAQQ